MKVLASLVALSASVWANPSEQDEAPQYLFANPSLETTGANNLRIPTTYESAVMGRRILALTPHGTISTVFPNSGANSHQAETESDLPPTTSEHRPEDVGGAPVGLIDYVADCEGTGDPTILAIRIATSFKNVREGSNISLSMHWTPPYPPARRIGGSSHSSSDDSPQQQQAISPSWFSHLLQYLPFVTPEPKPEMNKNTPPPQGDKEETYSYARTTYSAANVPRFNLVGELVPIPEANNPLSPVSRCFVETHPDARYWLPGNPIHSSYFVRLVVKQVYWIGGFGDRAYIGWIPAEEWKNVTVEEWKAAELPGEKEGWDEWSWRPSFESSQTVGLEL